ncbi:MAG TPA: hypothetical protein VGR62_15915 [Candidatus Binatia bacterium]|nr:hypothetical protein [Candidatus Binatia bacterium]
MSTRRDAALALLQRLGLDPATVEAGSLTDDALRALLDGPDAAAAAEALGEIGGAAVAQALVPVEITTTGALRKALRRALFRLEQRGIPVPERAPAPPPVRPLDLDVEGFVSAFDGRGDRLIWLTRSQPGGGTLVLDAIVHEPDGLSEVRLVEMSRRDVRRTRERLQEGTGLRLVPADWRALDALVVEAHHRAGAPDRQRDYLRLRPRLTSEPPHAPAELRSSRVTSPDDDEQAALLASGTELLSEPELRTWWPSREAADPILDEMRTVRDSPLVLGHAQTEERLRAVLARATATLFPAATTIRRLEGTAYVLAETGRVPAARRALAAAAALRARPDAADEVPLLAALVQQSIGAFFATEEAHRQDERRDSLVLTPGEALTAPGSSRPGRTPG